MIYRYAFLAEFCHVPRCVLQEAASFLQALWDWTVLWRGVGSGADTTVTLTCHATFTFL